MVGAALGDSVPRDWVFPPGAQVAPAPPLCTLPYPALCLFCQILLPRLHRESLGDLEVGDGPRSQRGLQPLLSGAPGEEREVAPKTQTVTFCRCPIEKWPGPCGGRSRLRWPGWKKPCSSLEALALPGGRGAADVLPGLMRACPDALGAPRSWWCGRGVRRVDAAFQGSSGAEAKGVACSCQWE